MTHDDGFDEEDYCIYKVKNGAPFPLWCDWSSFPTAEQPGLHTPEAGERV